MRTNVQPDLASIEADRVILNYAGVLRASKRKEYRAVMRATFTLFVKFLEDKGLTTRTILAADGSLADDAVVLRKDLEDEGVRLFFLGWEEWCDSSGSPAQDVEFWERKLEKLRETRGAGLGH